MLVTSIIRTDSGCKKQLSCDICIHRSRFSLNSRVTAWPGLQVIIKSCRHWAKNTHWLLQTNFIENYYAGYFSHPSDLEKFIARFCSPIPFFIYRHALKDSSLGIPLFTSNQIHLDLIFWLSICTIHPWSLRVWYSTIWINSDVLFGNNCDAARQELTSM